MPAPATDPDALTDATFSPDIADYPAEAALRRYPVTLTADGIDANADRRAAYREGLDHGLRLAAA